MATELDRATTIDASLLVEQLQRLARSSVSPSAKERQEASKKLTKLSSDVLNNPGILEVGGLNPLVDLMNSKETTVQFEACRILANLCQTEKFKTTIIAKRTLDALISLSYKGNLIIKRQVARAFAQLADSSTELQAKLVDLGILRPAVALMRIDNDDTRRHAASAIASIGEGPENIVKVLASGAVPELVSLINTATDSARAGPLADCARACANFGYNETARDMLVAFGATKALLAHLQTPAKEARPHIYRALHHLVMEDKGPFNLSDGDLKHLVSLLTGSNDPIVPIHAVGIIAGLTKEEGMRAKLLENFVLEPITPLARSGDYRLHLPAACALTWLSQQHESLNAIGKESIDMLCRTAKISKKRGLAPEVQIELDRCLLLASKVPFAREIIDATVHVCDMVVELEKAEGTEGVPVEAVDINARDANGWSAIHEAACLGLPGRVRDLLAQGCDVDDKDNEGSSPLHIACVWGHVEVARALLDAGAKIEHQDILGRTPLHRGCESGHADIIQLLAHRDAHPNRADNEGNTALHYAAAGGHDHIVEPLLKAGGAPFKRNKEFKTPYIVAMDANFTECAEVLSSLHAAVRNGSMEALQYLIRVLGEDVNVRDDNDATALHEACRRGNLEMAKFLVERGAKLDLRTKDNELPFHLACRSGSKELVEYLFQAQKRAKTGFTIEDKGKFGRTALHECCAEGHTPIAAFLLKKRAPINALDDGQSTPLHLACAGGHTECAALLIDRGADQTLVDANGKTALDLAAEHAAMLRERNQEASEFLKAVRAGDLDLVKSMYDAEGANIDLNKPELGTSYLQEAIKGGHNELAAWILEQDVDPDWVDKMGNTACHYAALADSEDAVKSLLMAGCNKYFKNKEGKTPRDLVKNKNSAVGKLLESLHEAVGANNMPVVDHLLRAGEHPDVLNLEGDAPIHIASEGAVTDMIGKLVKVEADIDAPDNNGRTAVTRACRQGHVSAMRQLFEQGEALPNKADEKGWAPLHHAVDLGKVEAAAVLVEYGGDKNQADNEGITPLMMAKNSPKAAEFAAIFNNLHLAAAGGILKDVMELVANGADVNGVDIDGNTPLHYAARRDQAEVVEYLIGEGSNVDAKNHFGSSPLHLACHKGASEAAAMLIDHEASINITDNLEQTPWHLGCQGGVTVSLLEALIEGGAEVKACDKIGNNGLHHAAIGGKDDVIDFILEGDICPYTNNNFDKTPYDLAVEHGHYECAVMLSTLHRAVENDDYEVADLHLQHGADVDEEDDEGETPLHLAGRVGADRCVSLLLENNANPSALNTVQRTPVHEAAQNGHVKSLIAMFEGGKADANIADVDKRTALHLAAQSGHHECCRILLNNGADANLQDKDGNTPYMLAALSGQKEAAELLGDFSRALASGYGPEIEMMIKNGVDVNKLGDNGQSALHEAVKLGKTDLVASLLERGFDINSQDRNKNTPLHLATELGLKDMVEYLLQNGADPNMQNRQGDTVLHTAIRLGNKELVELLLKHGADKTILNNDGQTPYALAVALNQPECAALVGDLFASVKAGDLDEAKLILGGGADVNLRDENAWTPLHHAIYLGDADMARLLIDSGADVNAEDDEGNTPLHLAVKCGNKALAGMLIQAGADINKRNKNEMSPLHLACSAGDVELARFLVEQGADVNLKDGNGLSCLHHSVLNGNDEVVAFLLEAGANADILNNDGLTPLQLAMQIGNKSCVSQLVDINEMVVRGDMAEIMKWLEAGANVNRADANGCTPLHEACRVGNAEIVAALLKAGAKPNVKDNEGNTPLHLATMGGHVPCVKLLLENDADLDIQDGKFRSPLHLAAFTQNLDISQLLVDHNANVDAQDVAGWSPLHLGVYIDSVPLVAMLLKGRANKHLKNNEGQTPCMMAVGKRCADLLLGLHDAARDGDLDEAKQLVAAGARVNARDDEGLTALHHAAAEGHDPMVDYLLGLGADPGIGDKNHLTGLHLAALAGHVPAGDSLCKGGAPLEAKDLEGKTPLHIAANAGNEDFVKMLLGHGADPNAQDTLGNTPLHYAVKGGHHAVAQALLAAGARPDLQNAEGETPFMIARAEGENECANLVADLCSAACIGDIDMLNNLLSLGGDPNMKDMHGSSALHEACRRGQLDCARALIQKGALVNGTDKHGATPLHVAMHAGERECGELLLNNGGDLNAGMLDGGNILHSAAAGGHVNCGELCLERGIAVNSTDNMGRTPLHMAALFGNVDMIDLLVKHGANLEAEDMEGFTPLNYALRAGPNANAAVQRLMNHLAAKRTEAERLAEEEFMKSSAEFNEGGAFQVGSDDMDVVLQVQQLQRLIRFAYSDDIEEQHQAARSLTNLSVNAVNQPRIVQAGGLILLNKLALSPYAAVAFQANRALANLCSHESNKLVMCDGESLTNIMQLGKTGNVAIKRQTSRALANMASHPETKVKMVRAGCVASLISAAYSHIVEVQRQAVRGMSSLSRAEETKQDMVTDNILEALMHLQSVGNDKLDLGVIWTLANLAEDSFNQDPVIEIGAIGFIVKMATFPNEDPMATMHAVRSLHYLSTKSEHHLLLLEAESLPPLIRHADNADIDADTRGHAVGALLNFAMNAANRANMLLQSALEPMVACIHNEIDKIALFASAGVLFITTKDKQQQQQQQQQGQAPPPQEEHDYTAVRNAATQVLQRLVSSEDPGVAAHAETMLKNLEAADGEGMSKI